MLNGLDLQKIADELEFDIEDVEMLLDVFIESAKESLVILETAIVNNDYDSIYSSAHSIKGSSANLTLDDISSLAKTLELAARNAEQINYQEIFIQLSNYINNLKTN